LNSFGMRNFVRIAITSPNQSSIGNRVALEWFFAHIHNDLSFLVEWHDALLWNKKGPPKWAKASPWSAVVRKLLTWCRCTRNELAASPCRLQHHPRWLP